MDQKLKIRSAGKKGLGVFATRPIKRGETVEVARLLILNARDYATVQKTSLAWYIYAVGAKGAGLGTGFASLFNHAEAPNTTYAVNKEKRRLTFKALRDIQDGEEITIDYGYHPAKPETWGSWANAQLKRTKTKPQTKTKRRPAGSQSSARRSSRR